MASLLSSIPFLDLIDSFILLAAEVVAIIYLREEAHSAFWFMLLDAFGHRHAEHVSVRETRGSAARSALERARDASGRADR